MRIDATSYSEKRHNCLPCIAKGAAIGAAAGAALKYIQPVTRDEKNTNVYKSVIDEIKNRRNVFSAQTKEYLAEISAKPNKSVAEDAFIKMFDGAEVGKSMPKLTLLRAVKKLQKSNPGEVNEFLNICMDARKMLENTMKKSLESYDLVTKSLRPTSFFLITGAVVGALVGLGANILRNDVKS